jgi:Fe-S-cluster-containing hydrogenase component 2
MMRRFPRPADAVASNYYAQVNTELCTGCKICVDRCPIDAVKVEGAVASVDLARCIGCGLCVPTCSENAMFLVKKAQEIVPPETEEQFYDSIMAPKKTIAGKMRNYFLKTFMRVVSRVSG